MRWLVALALVLLCGVALVGWKLAGPEAAPEPAGLDPGEGVILLGAPPAAPRPHLPVPAAPPPQQAPAAPGPGPSGARIVFHPPQASREPAGPVIHAVRPGDSLYRIVELSYGRWSPRLQAAVAEANGLADPSRIHPGQELELPVVEGFPPPRPN